MKHLGDITKIDGSKIEKVDVITFGSPCQDLSNAGKRAGLKHEGNGDDETTRSGLFFEAIRIIKEMREDDGRSGRAVEFIRPRYGILENVPGLYNSDGGKDFQTVLTEFVRIAQPESPDVPMPKGGKWPKAGCLYGMGANGVPFSIAWKLHDAQWWGVPQRRRRVCVLGDFNGLSAGDILFDPQLWRKAPCCESDKAVGDTGGIPGHEVRSFGESVSGDPEQGEEEGQGTSEGTEGEC